MKPKDVRVLRVDCDHSEHGKWRVHLLEEEWKALSESYDRIFQDRYDLLTVHTKEGMLASEWLMRTATAERERDEARDLLRAVAAACRGLGPRTDAVMSVVGNALADLDSARAEVERLRWGNDMACENTPTAGCECPGCETARSRAEKGEAGP